MERGDIFLVDFEPSNGAEIKKKRPALIIPCNEANAYLKTVMVISLSSKIDAIHSFEVLVKKEASGLDVDSKLKIPQMRAVDKKRLTKYIGTVPGSVIEETEKAIKLLLDME